MLGAIASVLGGDLNPHFFNYPSLFIYLATLVHFVASGFFASGTSVWALSHDVLLHARFLGALFGALTVPVVFGLGREIGGIKVGVLAALFVCFAPAHVQHSHFATVDVAAMFWVALSILFATRALKPEDPATKLLLLSALCAGLGVATKYNAVLVLIAPIVAAFLIEYSNGTIAKRAQLTLNIVGVAIVGFLIGCPFSVLSFKEFWGDSKNVGVAYELLVHPKQGSGDIFTNTGNGWWYHATFNLPFVLTAPVAIAAFCGIGLVLTRMLGTRKTGFSDNRVLVPTVAFALLYFGTLGLSQVRFLRYVLPLVPALAIFAALFVKFLATKLRSQSFATGIAAILLLVCAIGTFDVVWPLTQTDPRDQAKHWMDAQNDATPLSVGLADAQTPLWFYTPPFWSHDAPPGSPFSWQDEKYVPRNPRYDLRALGLDASALQKNRPRYFVWSEFQWRERERLNDLSVAQLRRQLAIEYSMRSFHNETPLQLPGRALVPHDFLYTNPRVEVWARK